MRIVCDIGGTNMRVAAVAGEALGDARKVPTPKDPAEGVAMFAALARECAGKEAIGRIAGCVAGMVSDEGVISDARTLRAWEGINIVRELSNALGASADIVNDAACAGMGEGYAGAGKGAKRLAYLTVSTGVGGALIVDGEIAAAGGVAGIKIGDEELEDLISGTAIRKRFGVDPRDLDSLEIREGLADTLAEGLRIVVEEWSPDMIVLGGSMITGVNPIPFSRAQESLYKSRGEANSPIIKKAELGDSGGLWGGIARLKRLSEHSSTSAT